MLGLDMVKETGASRKGPENLTGITRLEVIAFLPNARLDILYPFRGSGFKVQRLGFRSNRNH